MSGAWGFVAVPRVNGRCAEGEAAAEQLASAKGESPLAQKRKALALQVLFVVEHNDRKSNITNALNAMRGCELRSFKCEDERTHFGVRDRDSRYANGRREPPNPAKEK